MKKLLALIFVSLAFISTNGHANGHHRQAQKAKARDGDTVFPGSPEWIHAGSPRNTATGEGVILIWGADGTLHPIGYAIEDTGGNWVANTPENRKMVADHWETKRLIATAREIMRETPDSIILRPAKARIVTDTTPDTGYDPYKIVMQWADSIATFYNDSYFLEGFENYYKRPRKVDWYPYYDPIRS